MTRATSELPIGDWDSQPKDFHLGLGSIITPCSQDCTGAYPRPKVSIVRLIFRHWDIQLLSSLATIADGSADDAAVGRLKP